MKKPKNKINNIPSSDLPLRWLEAQEDKDVKVVGETELCIHLKCEGGDVWHRKK